ncbi:MAG: CZB domain-containing protein [Psychromonas sp.]|nr:CZB domain-containing protein [Psychromonas sp.]
MNKAHFKKEITKAISGHGIWKNTLRNAIDTGKSSSTPEKVQHDYHCSFGKWLYVRIDPSLKQGVFYNEIIGIHKTFHIQAAIVLTLALKGKKEEASKLIQLGSEFSKISSLLISKLTEWQESI